MRYTRANNLHMRWLKPNLKSIYGMLGHAGPLAEPTAEMRTLGVRQAMLAAMAGGDLSERYPLVARRIFYADDIKALWYVRSDLMAALAGEWGETVAQEKIAVLTRLFEGLLPEARGNRESRRPR